MRRATPAIICVYRTLLHGTFSGCRGISPVPFVDTFYKVPCLSHKPKDIK